MTYLSEHKTRITWRINEKPSQEKMEDFLMEILELTEKGQMLLRARNQSMEADYGPTIAGDQKHI